MKLLNLIFILKLIAQSNIFKLLHYITFCKRGFPVADYVDKRFLLNFYFPEPSQG